jgi:hypothetical protein
MGGVIMISRIAIILFLTVSATAIVSAQSQPKQLTKEEEQKKQEEFRKKIKETLDAAVSDVALLKNLENKTFFQVRIACLLWKYDEKGARLLLDDAQGLTVSMINDPKISVHRSDFERETWERRIQLRSELVSMIAERDPQAALEFLRQTRFVIPQDGMQSDRARDALRWDAELEQKLALRVAKNDPKRALEIAEESLKKGISPELNELVRVVFEKDKEAGKKLAGAILSKLKSTDITDRGPGVGVALSILEEEYASRRPESSVGGNLPGARKRQPVLDDQALREWNNFLIQTFILTGNAIQTGGLNYTGPFAFLSGLLRLIPEIEKLSPTLAANFKQWHSQQRFDQHAPEMRMGPIFFRGTGNAKAEDLLATALKSQGHIRREYINWAVDEALDSERNIELARKIAEEHITDPDERKDKMERINEKAKQYSLEHGKIEDVASALMSLESDAERAGSLSDLAGRALKSGDKKLAADLLEKALRFLLQPVETRDEYEAMIRIIHNSIGVDRERSFEMYGSLIDPINQLVTATIQLNRFEGKRSDYLRDELPLYYIRSDFPSHEERGNFPAKGFIEVIVPLSKADFDRSIGLADRIRQPELKLHMKLLAIQAATSE